jgi:hypothetical protein
MVYWVWEKRAKVFLKKIRRISIIRRINTYPTYMYFTNTGYLARINTCIFLGTMPTPDESCSKK